MRSAAAQQRCAYAARTTHKCSQHTTQAVSRSLHRHTQGDPSAATSDEIFSPDRHDRSRCFDRQTRADRSCPRRCARTARRLRAACGAAQCQCAQRTEHGTQTNTRALTVIELDDCLRRLATHVLNGVLVAEPVGALDRVVHVVAPVVLLHVANRRVDAALRCHSVRADNEQTHTANDDDDDVTRASRHATHVVRARRHATYRVGNTFVIHAVLKPCSVRPRAARKPAPPAPTTTAARTGQ